MVEPERVIMGAEPKPPIAEIVKRTRTRRFRSVRHGLDYAQVDDVLMAILSRIEALQAELQQPRDAAEVPPNGEDTEDARSVSASPAEDVSDARTERIARFSVVGEREAARISRRRRSKRPRSSLKRGVRSIASGGRHRPAPGDRSMRRERSSLRWRGTREVCSQRRGTASADDRGAPEDAGAPGERGARSRRVAELRRGARVCAYKPGG